MQKVKRLSFIEKRKLKLKEKALAEYGITLDTINNDDYSKESNRLIICLIRGILIFFASFGTVGGVVSAFELNYNILLVLPTLLFLSLCISILYYNKVTFYIGYIILFIFFSIMSFSLYFYINSGFQAFTNVLFEKYSNYFALDVLRESTEFITDRYTTVSVTMIFVGVFLAVLLNITISGYMSIAETFLVTFPIIELALYIDLEPGFIYLILLFVVYITVGILNRSGHFKLTSIKQSKESFYTIKNKKMITHSYMSDGKGMLYAGLYSFSFAALFLILASGIFYSDYDSRIINNKLKATTDDYIKTFVQNGLSSFFDRYNSVGGLNQGQLGGVGRVTPDYQTDLVITFVPVDTKTLYLKGFVGNNYLGNAFEADTTLINEFKNEVYNPSSVYSFSEYLRPSQNIAKMKIENIDAGNLDCLPYETIFYKYNKSIYSAPFNYNDKYISYHEANAKRMLMATDNNIEDDPDSLKTLEIIYDPYIVDYNGILQKEKLLADDYEHFVYKHYTNVPENLEEMLNDICDEAGLYKIDNSDKSLKGRREYQLNVLHELKNFFYENFEYTMAPGTTPRKKDVIEFFLTEKRKGFCAHFASSATLLLREMGIPTRYVEGYAVSLSEIVDGNAVSKDSSNWITDISLSRFDEAGVISVDVTDGSAHGWVEAYIDGYGWIPYEFTPPSIEENVSNFNLGGLFSGLFMISENNNENTHNQETRNNNFSMNFAKSLSFITTPMIFIIIAVIISIIIVYYSDSIFKFIKIKQYLKKDMYSEALRLDFIKFTNYLKKHSKKNNLQDLEHSTIRDYEDYINTASNNITIDLTEAFSIISRAFYSPNPITNSDYDEAIKVITSIKEILSKEKKKK